MDNIQEDYLGLFSIKSVSAVGSRKEKVKVSVIRNTSVDPIEGSPILSTG
jgi:hypothetical protein